MCFILAQNQILIKIVTSFGKNVGRLDYQFLRSGQEKHHSVSDISGVKAIQLTGFDHNLEETFCER